MGPRRGSKPDGLRKRERRQGAPKDRTARPVNGGMIDARVFAEGSEPGLANWIAAREGEGRNVYYTHNVVSPDFTALCNANATVNRHSAPNVGNAPVSGPKPGSR